MIKISDGNSKMGVVPSFSLPAGVTCSPEACRTCYKDGCYARKIERIRPNVHAAYMRNLQLCKENLQFVEQYFMCYFGGLNAPRVFRLHVSGDFFSTEYFRDVAACNCGKSGNAISCIHEANRNHPPLSAQAAEEFLTRLVCVDGRPDSARCDWRASCCVDG